MTTSKRIAGRKVARFEKNALRGAPKKGWNFYVVSLSVIAAILLLVFGSSLLQIIKAGVWKKP